LGDQFVFLNIGQRRLKRGTVTISEAGQVERGRKFQKKGKENRKGMNILAERTKRFY